MNTTSQKSQTTKLPPKKKPLSISEKIGKVISSIILFIGTVIISIILQIYIIIRFLLTLLSAIICFICIRRKKRVILNRRHS